MATGLTGSGVTLSHDLENLQTVINKLQDNNTNLISAKDVRDSVYTLWLRTENNNTDSVLYQNSEPVPIKVGGIEANTTFDTPATMQEMWDRLLYPYIPLTSSLSISGSSVLEYGDPDGLNTNNIQLNWSVIKKTEPIISITVDGENFTANGGNQNGTKLTTGSYPVNPGSQHINTFSMSAIDNKPTTTNSSIDLIWRNRIYWGNIDLSSLGNPNLTNNTSTLSQIQNIVNSSFIRNLNGAGVGNGNQLSNTKNKIYNNIGGGGNYLIFAWPTSVDSSKNPSFTVNNQPNNAFTRVRTDWNFQNQYGFQTNYEVWITNTVQNSPIGTLQIS